MDGAASAHADDLHRIRLLAASAPRRALPDRAGKNADPLVGTDLVAKPASRASRHQGLAVRAPRENSSMPALQVQIPARAKTQSDQVMQIRLALSEMLQAVHRLPCLACYT